MLYKINCLINAFVLKLKKRVMYFELYTTLYSDSYVMLKYHDIVVKISSEFIYVTMSHLCITKDQLKYRRRTYSENIYIFSLLCK